MLIKQFSKLLYNLIEDQEIKDRKIKRKENWDK